MTLEAIVFGANRASGMSQPGILLKRRSRYGTQISPPLTAGTEHCMCLELLQRDSSACHDCRHQLARRRWPVRSRLSPACNPKQSLEPRTQRHSRQQMRLLSWSWVPTAPRLPQTRSQPSRRSQQSSSWSGSRSNGGGACCPSPCCQVRQWLGGLGTQGATVTVQLRIHLCQCCSAGCASGNPATHLPLINLTASLAAAEFKRRAAVAPGSAAALQAQLEARMWAAADAAVLRAAGGVVAHPAATRPSSAAPQRSDSQQLPKQPVASPPAVKAAAETPPPGTPQSTGGGNGGGGASGGEEDGLPTPLGLMAAVLKGVATRILVQVWAAGLPVQLVASGSTAQKLPQQELANFVQAWPRPARK